MPMSPGRRSPLPRSGTPAECLELVSSYWPPLSAGPALTAKDSVILKTGNRFTERWAGALLGQGLGVVSENLRLSAVVVTCWESKKGGTKHIYSSDCTSVWQYKRKALWENWFIFLVQISPCFARRQNSETVQKSSSLAIAMSELLGGRSGSGMAGGMYPKIGSVAPHVPVGTLLSGRLEQHTETVMMKLIFELIPFAFFIFVMLCNVLFCFALFCFAMCGLLILLRGKEV